MPAASLPRTPSPGAPSPSAPGAGATADVFISYARREFHFAEHVARRLIDRGVSVWLDVVRLEAGADWEQGLQDGMRDAEAVVLVASPAALASEHVRAEWRSAQAACIPIHVVIADVVELPAELSPASVTDLRIRFDRGFDAVLAALAAGHAPDDAELRRSFSRRRASLGVRLVDVSLLLIALTIAFVGGWAAVGLAHHPNAAAQLRSDGTARATALIAIASWLGLTTVGLAVWRAFRLRRVRAFPLALWLATSLSVAVLYLGGRADTLNSSFDFPRDPALAQWNEHAAALGTSEAWLWVPLMMWFVLSLPAWTASTKPAIFRWLPTGGASDMLRSRHGLLPRDIVTQDGKQDELRRQLRVPAPMALYLLIVALRYARRWWRDRRVAGDASPPLGEPFLVHHDASSDAEVAADVRRALGKEAGIGRDGDPSVSRHVLVVSSETRGAWLQERLAELRGRVVCVFATSVGLENAPPELCRRQWVDYRKRRRTTIDGLAWTFADGARDRSRLAILPERLELPQMPNAVRATAALLVGLAAVHLGSAICAPWIAEGREAERFDVWFRIAGVEEAAIAAIAGATLALLALLLVRRRLTRTGFVAGAFISAALSAAVAGPPLAALMGSEGDGRRWDPEITIIVTIVTLVIAAGELSRWLPRRLEPTAGREATLQVPSAGRGWMALVCVLTVMVASATLASI